MTYYYFAASLPVLEFGMRPPYSVEEFLADCQRLVSEKDFADIQSAVNDDDENAAAHNAVLRQWKTFLHYFRNESACFRAGQANKDPHDYVRGERSAASGVGEALSRAAKSEDPLSAETLLDRFFWQSLDDLAAGHYFDIEFIIVYAIKLKILERHEEIGSSKGREIFEEYKKKAFVMR